MRFVFFYRHYQLAVDSSNDLQFKITSDTLTLLSEYGTQSLLYLRLLTPYTCNKIARIIIYILSKFNKVKVIQQ